MSAKDGDIGVVERNSIEAGCVVMNGKAVGINEDGYYHLPTMALSRVFSV